jgi:asparagine synthase (glutamine-hydrolysing)
MYRFVALLWHPADAHQRARTTSLANAFVTSRPGWSVVYDGPGALALHAGSHPLRAPGYVLSGNCGVILGKLFRKENGDHATARQIGNETRRIIDSGGQHLIDHYWGAYVAVLYDAARGRHHVLREPTTNLACYRTGDRGIEVFFSHAEDCVTLLPRRFDVDRHYLARWLLLNRLISRNCGIEGIEDVPGAERLTFAGTQITRTRLWKPEQIAASAPLEDIGASAKALRQVTQNVINSWASCYEDITHRLSGGLDSSIVAGCLAQAPSRPRIRYLNLFTQLELHRDDLRLEGVDPRIAAAITALAGGGDERYYARLVAQRWRVPLIERARSVDMDLKRMWQAPLSLQPALYFTGMDVDDIDLELVGTHRTEAFFSGQAGDSVFFAALEPLGAIDYAWLHGLRRGLWRHACTSAALSRQSVWGVLAAAIRHGRLRHAYLPPIRLLDQPTLAPEAVIRTLKSDDTDSSGSASALPPGKRRHVEGLSGSSYLDFVFHSGTCAAHVNPLNSQPLWEQVLRIPTYALLAGGTSRGLARRAFADLLPPQIAKRQAKATGAPFYQAVVDRNRDFLRETLLDGVLVREGYLDRARLEASLEPRSPRLGTSASQLLSCLAAQAWVHRWRGLRQSTRHECAAG